MTDNQKLKLYQQVRASFRDYNREIDPNYSFNETEKTTEHLLKVVDLVAKNNADPDTFVKAQFEALKKRGILFSSMLVSKEAEKNYLNHIQVSDELLTKTFDMYCGYLAATLKNTSFTLEQILNDKNARYPAWFRVVISKEPIPSVLNSFGEEACRELRRYKNLEKFLVSKKLDVSRLCK